VKAAKDARLVDTSHIPGCLDRVHSPLADQILRLLRVDDHWFVGLGRFLTCRHDHSDYNNDEDPKVTKQASSRSMVGSRNLVLIERCANQLWLTLAGTPLGLQRLR
jgi:hypothetical protein